jgi:hypothetical protein
VPSYQPAAGMISSRAKRPALSEAWKGLRGRVASAARILDTESPPPAGGQTRGRKARGWTNRSARAAPPGRGAVLALTQRCAPLPRNINKPPLIERMLYPLNAILIVVGLGVVPTTERRDREPSRRQGQQEAVLMSAPPARPRPAVRLRTHHRLVLADLLRSAPKPCAAAF